MHSTVVVFLYFFLFAAILLNPISAPATSSCSNRQRLSDVSWYSISGSVVVFSLATRVSVSFFALPLVRAMECDDVRPLYCTVQSLGISFAFETTTTIERSVADTDCLRPGTLQLSLGCWMADSLQRNVFPCVHCWLFSLIETDWQVNWKEY